MKKSTKKSSLILLVIVALLLVGLISSLVWGKTIRMARANHALTAGQLETARKIYEDLAVDLPDSPHALYNLGLAAYRQGQYQVASDYFHKTLKHLEKQPRAKQNRDLTAKCRYQLGSSQFKLAETGPTGPDSKQQPPVELYRLALENFRGALVLTPADTDAKYNYELTKLRLDDIKDQNQSRQNQQDNQSQKNKDDKRQNQNKQDQNKQSPPDQKQQNQDFNTSKGADQKGQNRAQDQKETNQGQAAGQKDGLSKEEARALLEAAENGAQYMAPIISDHSEVQKDW
jgi:hypothetical protein